MDVSLPAPAVSGDQLLVLGLNRDEPNPSAPKSPCLAVRDYLAACFDFLLRTGQREAKRDLGPWFMGQPAGVFYRDAANRDVLGLAQMHVGAILFRNRERRRYPPGAAPLFFGLAPFRIGRGQSPRTGDMKMITTGTHIFRY